jgi:predicted ATPase/class 3 adenylate cyclase
VRSDLPSGTVTLVFSDIEGSTKLLETLGTSAYREALAEHRQIVRQAFARYSGYEVDYEGDAFFYAFSSAEEALSAVSEAMQGLEGGPIAIRVGIHTGSPELDPPKYVGLDVHTAARIMSCGHGGQVVVSETTRELVSAQLTELGSHRLKDIQEPVSLYQLGDRSFPPLKTIANTNLPAPASTFLGRGEELYEADTLLQETRLLTVTGPGGQGKTRFALELATRAREERFSDYRDGVFSCFFSSLRDPALVLPTIASTLSVREQPAERALETLSSHLEGKRMLLLLDNLEHLLEAASELSELLSLCPGLTLLCTSRERLSVQGERAYVLPPLAEDEGVSLFCARAETEPSEDIMALCSRLEGLPLAIELAAARTRILTPEQLLERLSQRLDLLKGGRDADPRQQTLRATIEWSYDLLSPEEQELFARLCVFAGGCTLEAAEEVCEADLDTLQSLVDKSLLRFTEGRYWMLETIREYAGERLAARGERDSLFERHATWYALRGASLLWPARIDEPGARDALDRDLLDIHQGLGYALGVRDVRLAGECLFALWLPWLLHGFGDYGVAAAHDWLALDRELLHPLARAPGLIAAGEILRFAGDLQTAREVKLEELAIARRHPDAVVHGRALGGDIPYSLSDLASVELALGDIDAARWYSDEAIAVWRERGDGYGLGHALDTAVSAALLSGELRHAWELATECVTAFEEHGSAPEDVATARLKLADCELRLGDVASAAAHLRTVIALLNEEGGSLMVAACARVAAMIAFELGDPKTAALLSAAFVGLLAKSGNRLENDPTWQRSHEELTERLDRALSTEALAQQTALADGLSNADVLALAERAIGLSDTTARA